MPSAATIIARAVVAACWGSLVAHVRRSSPRVRARALIRLAVLGLVRCLGELSDVVIASREYAILVSETRT